MDFHVIEDLNNCIRTVHEPVKHPDNPLIKPENFENGANPYCGTALHDPETGRLRMWLGSGGFIRAAAREDTGVRDGEWSDAWRFEKSELFSGDSLDHILTWQGQGDLGAFPGEGVLRLHFWLEDAKLYSFWFE